MTTKHRKNKKIKRRTTEQSVSWPKEQLWQLRLRPYASLYRPFVKSIQVMLKKKNDYELTSIIADCDQATTNNCPSDIWAVAGIVKYEAQVLYESRPSDVESVKNTKEN
jgi:hypothetical protein